MSATSTFSCRAALPLLKAPSISLRLIICATRDFRVEPPPLPLFTAFELCSLIENRGVMILDPDPESDFQLLAILDPDLDPVKLGLIAPLEVS